MTIQCCKCSKIHAEGDWKDPITALAGAVSHAYCPACVRDMRARLHLQRARAFVQLELARSI